MSAKSSFPTQIGLWIFSALIMALIFCAKLAADRFFEPSDEGPSDGPAMTIRVDHPVVMKGDAAALIAFVERAVNSQQGGVDVRFLGESTDLTVYFGGRRYGANTGVAIDAMLIEVGPTAYVAGGEVIDQQVIANRMRKYVEAAAISGATPIIELKVKHYVPLSRLVEFFKLSASLGQIHYEMESVSVVTPKSTLPALDKQRENVLNTGPAS